MSDLGELIARLEKAEGPSLELDARIWCLLHGYEFVEMNGDSFRYVPKPGAGHTWSHQLMRREKVLASIDAALTLVPAGWQWGIGTHPPGELFNPAGAQAYCTKDAPGGEFEHTHADAATPALALCIAALKARQQPK